MLQQHLYYATCLCICWYGAVCWDPCREGQVSALNRVQKRAAKFANNITESGWETFDTGKTDNSNMPSFQGIYRRRAWNQLPASSLESFPFKLNKFMKGVKNVFTSK